MTNTFSLSRYNVTDSFDLYQREIRAFPSLTAEEEHELGTKLKLNNDLEAAKKLILSHLKLVIKIARSYSGYGLPVSDLVQEGNVGLMKAVKKFDVDKGVRLVSYAIFWIKAEIQEYVVKNWRLVKNATTKAQRKLFFNLRSMKKTLKPLSVDEIRSIANDLNVKESDVKEMEYRMNGQELTIDYSDDDSDEDSFRPISYLEDLKNAIQAYGRAKDQAAAAKFIAKRAKALSAEDLIPDTEDFQKALKEASFGRIPKFGE